MSRTGPKFLIGREPGPRGATQGAPSPGGSGPSRKRGGPSRDAHTRRTRA